MALRNLEDSLRTATDNKGPNTFLVEPPRSQPHTNHPLTPSTADYVKGHSSANGSWIEKHMAEINHYSMRILIDSWVPVIGAIALTAPALIGVAAVIINEPYKPAFYHKKMFTSDGTEQYQIKTRTMSINADKEWNSLASQGKLSPGGFKSKDDPRVTKVGKILRKTALDEVWQLWQLANHVYSSEGFFYNKNKHFHYTVAPRPQTEYTIAHAPLEFREALCIGRTGITGPYQVGEGSEGECAKKFNHDFETKWIIPPALQMLFKTPFAMFFGHNA